MSTWQQNIWEKNTYANEAAQATIRLSPRNRYLKVRLLRQFRGVEVGVGKTSDDSTVQIVPAFIVIIQGTFDEVV